MDHDAADWRTGLQLCECCFRLTDGGQLGVFLVSISVRQCFERNFLRFDPLHEFPMRLQLQFAHFSPHQHCPVGIGFGTEPAAPRQNRTQPLSWLNAVCAGVEDFPTDSHGCANVGPARKLSNRQDVAIAKWNIARGLSAHCRREVDLLPVTWTLWRSVCLEAREIGAIRISAPLQSTSYTDQIFDAHVRCEGITARLGHFALDVNRRGINTSQIAVDQQTVAGLEKNVVHWISRESFMKVDAQNFHVAVGLRAEKL